MNRIGEVHEIVVLLPDNSGQSRLIARLAGPENRWCEHLDMCSKGIADAARRAHHQRHIAAKTEGQLRQNFGRGNAE